DADIEIVPGQLAHRRIGGRIRVHRLVLFAGLFGPSDIETHAAAGEPGKAADVRCMCPAPCPGVEVFREIGGSLGFDQREYGLLIVFLGPRHDLTPGRIASGFAVPTLSSAWMTDKGGRSCEAWPGLTGGEHEQC